MAYRDNSEKSAGGFWKMAGGLLAGVLAFAIAKTATHSGSDFLQRSTTTESKVERILENDPKFAATFLEMKREFPTEYHSLTSELASVIRSGASNEVIGQRAHGAMRQFTQRHMRDITSASDQTLFKIAVAQADVARALSYESRSVCADFGMVGIRPGTKLSDQSTTLIAENVRLLVVAAREGAQNPKRRETGMLSDSDSTQFVAALRKQGMTDRQLKLFTTDGAVQRASAADQCEMTVQMYEAIGQLPVDASARVLAMVFSQAPA